MSNLRDRLKKISATPKAPVVEAAPPACACLREVRPLAALRLDKAVLALLGGDEVRAAYAGPERLAFLDTETTGLSQGAGTVVFQVGVGLLRGETMEITQLWMRDYGEEEDMLLRLNELLRGVSLLVTFNGRSFDVPLLKSRCTLNRLRAPWADTANLDLLYPARRLYKIRLKRCPLSALEEAVLGVKREGDIPGAEIPALWHSFLKSGDDTPLRAVFTHNAQDVFSMALLLQAMHDAHQSPLELAHDEDIYSMGRILEKAGMAEKAEPCYRQVQGTRFRSASGRALSRIYRRAGREEERLALLGEMVAARVGGIFPYVELAKIYEHRLRRPDLALEQTDRALALASDKLELDELRKRRARLVKQINTISRQ